MSCVLCRRRSDEVFCSLHQKALGNIVHSYKQWRNATSLGWEDYLKRIEENQYSGRWVVEVCRYLLMKEKKHSRPLKLIESNILRKREHLVEDCGED